MIKKLLHASRNALLLGALAVPAVHAQESAANFPSKQVRIIVPFVAGGGSDQMARLLAHKLADKWGQRVIVENRPGGNTVIATQATARAAPDGYTMILVNSTFAINTILTPDLPYDSDKDFAAVAGMGATPFLMASHPSVPANNFKEMMGLLKAGKPGDWNFATVGSTGIGRIAGETFAQQTGVQLQHIPFKGSPEAIQDTIAGRTSFYMAPINTTIGQLKEGKLLALGVSTKRRADVLPDLATLAEQGLADFNISLWFGMWAPAGTPPAAVQKLNAMVNAALQVPDVKEQFAKLGITPNPLKPDEFGRFVRDEIATYQKVVKSANIQPQ